MPALSGEVLVAAGPAIKKIAQILVEQISVMCAKHMVELQVHLTERLLHVQNVLGRDLQQAATVPPKGTDGTDRTGWLEAGP